MRSARTATKKRSCCLVDRRWIPRAAWRTEDSLSSSSTPFSSFTSFFTSRRSLYAWRCAGAIAGANQDLSLSVMGVAF